MKITLTPDEIEYCKTQAKKRNNPKLARVKNRRVDASRGDWQINFQGIKAEFAVCKAFDVDYDDVISLAGDGGIKDTVIGDKTAQIKYNNYPRNAYLYFNHKEITSDGRCTCCKWKIRKSEVFLADLAILVLPCNNDDSSLEIVGWISREEFLNECETLNFGYGDRFGVKAQNLREIASLEESLKNLPCPVDKPE